MSSTSTLRELIAATATDLGPDAPTLCDPWTVRDLLAHLVLRESRPDALPGVGLPVAALQRHTQAVQDKVAERDLSALVGRVRQGSPAWWPTRLPVLDRMANLTELTIHHEDMVRAQPGWEPTTLPEAVQAHLWDTLSTTGRLLYRSAPVGVVAIAPGHGRVALRRPPATAGTVVLRGTPLELVLHAFGRSEHAQVVVEGTDEDVAALASHRRRA